MHSIARQKKSILMKSFERIVVWALCDWPQPCQPPMRAWVSAPAIDRPIFSPISFFNPPKLNRCIGNDTKAAARQSLNCIENKKITYGEKRFSIWRMEFLHPAIWHDHDIDFTRLLHPAMWHVALGSWQWIHQVAVAYPATWHVALGWHVIEFVR